MHRGESRARRVRLPLLMALAGCAHTLQSTACVDILDSCATQARNGECENMDETCPVSCGTCPTEGYSCEDIGPDEVKKDEIVRVFQRLMNMTEYSPALLSTNPPILQFDNWLSESQAVEVVQAASHKFEAISLTREEVLLQNCSMAWCGVETCRSADAVLSLSTRLAHALQWPLKNSEPISVVRYEEGQFYGVHHDYNDSHRDSPAGPRIFTALVYLSSACEGGDTVFPYLNLTIKPQTGRAIIWSSASVDDVYRLEPRTRHGSMPVVKGTKYAANFWTRLRDFRTPARANCGDHAVRAAERRRKKHEKARKKKHENKLLDIAVKFLTHPKTRDMKLEQKMAYLQSRGLSKSQQEQAVKRAEILSSTAEPSADQKDELR